MLTNCKMVFSNNNRERTMAIKIWGTRPHSEDTCITIKAQDIKLERTYADSLSFSTHAYHVEINGNALHDIFLDSLRDNVKFRKAVAGYINGLERDDNDNAM
jgi:hypothetical protein